MTLGLSDLALYAGALFVLFLTPGPVWVAIVARSLSAGFAGAWPLAMGVVVGDVLWPLLAILGVSWVLSVYGGFLEALRYAAAVIFLLMGAGLIRHRHRLLGENSALTAPGAWAGFTAGLLAILGNPKAILFYMGVLPGFFDLSRVTTADIVAICAISALVPFIGNLALGLSLDRVRAIIASPEARARINFWAGVVLILVGFAIVLI
ncbi:LysE family translocator [Halovulum dunhuangense]|uniref:LysE family translocator n=1 Tax=Halovulum dunhuangense TaxID=1505036 RepID=A0A849KQK0_9RHOB|nr:LysE family translocator [Halovulum dunhuangense]NNU79129.1 LysE family translocator [Halovulum dunhuangense]